MDKYRTIWMKNFADELGRLIQGIWNISGTNTIWFIRRSGTPKGCTVPYGHIVVNYCPHKKYTNHTRSTVGGDRIHYPRDVSTPTSYLSTSNILFNYVISTPGAIFITMDIKNILPWHLHETSRIHAPTNKHHISVNNWYLQLERIRRGWLYLLQDR